MYKQNHNCECNSKDQKHVHEITGHTASVQECSDCHDHRFCTVSGEAIPYGNSHVHEIKFHTDTSDGHYHEFCGKTCPAVEVGNGKHVHYINDFTEREDGHKHQFQAATLIDSPSDFDDCK